VIPRGGENADESRLPEHLQRCDPRMWGVHRNGPPSLADDDPEHGVYAHYLLSCRWTEWRAKAFEAMGVPQREAWRRARHPDRGVVLRGRLPDGLPEEMPEVRAWPIEWAGSTHNVWKADQEREAYAARRRK
jgi:hypothetical protein